MWSIVRVGTRGQSESKAGMRMGVGQASTDKGRVQRGAQRGQVPGGSPVLCREKSEIEADFFSELSGV